MLSTVKLPLITLTFLIFTSGHVFAIDLNTLRNQVKSNYYNQNTIEKTAERDPNYDPNTNWQTAQDSDAQSKFLNYGATITGSCTAIIKETTNELICTERTDDVTKITNHTQIKSLIDINWIDTIIQETIEVYYCDVNNEVYKDIDNCNSVCTYFTCPLTYVLDSGQCYATPLCVTGTTYNTTTKQCEKTNTYSCSLGGTYTTSSACTSGCKNTVAATVNTTYGCTYTNGFFFRIISTDCNSVTLTYECDEYNTLTINLNKGESTVYKCFDNSAYPEVKYDYDGRIYQRGAVGLSWQFYGTYTTNYITSTSYSCPPGYTLSGTSCIKTGTCSLSTCLSGTSASGTLCVASPYCSSGGAFESSIAKCELGATVNYVACTTQEGLENTLVEQAQLVYTENPYPMPEECGTTLPYSCLNSSNMCITKNIDGSCKSYDTVCTYYERPYSCTITEHHTYKDCNYQATTTVVNGN